MNIYPQKGSWIKLAEAVASNDATIDFEGVINSTYKQYMVVFENVVPVTDDVDLYMRVGTGGTPTYQTGSVYDTGGTLYDHLFITNVGMGSAADEGLSGRSFMYDPSASSHTRVKNTTIYDRASTGGTIGNDLSGRYDSTIPVTAIRFYMDSGNIESGTFTLYGFKI